MRVRASHRNVRSDLRSGLARQPFSGTPWLIAAALADAPAQAGTAS
jgi:hypothetical protein